MFTARTIERFDWPWPAPWRLSARGELRRGMRMARPEPAELRLPRPAARRPVQQAAHTTTFPANRSLSGAPPADAAHLQSPARPDDRSGEEKTRLTSDGARSRASGAPARESKHVLATVGSLAAVLGLFAIVVWTIRRGMPKSLQQRLPSDVVDVLGQATLGHRQHVQLIRLGQRLLLVSVTPNGAETLTEVTDAAEVERLTTLCRGPHSRGATPSFRDVFQQFRTPAATVVASKPRPTVGTILKSQEARDG